MPRKKWKKKNRIKARPKKKTQWKGVVWHWQLTAGFTPPIVASAVPALYLLDGMRAAAGALLEANVNWCHRSWFQINSPFGHVTLDCHCTCWREHDAVHVWRQYTHWTWHCTSSDLLEYHTARQILHAVGPSCPGTCDAVNKGCVVGPAEVDMRNTIWLDKMLHDTAVSAVCRWTWSPLNVMLPRAVSVDSLEETLHSARRYLQVCDAVITYSALLNLLEMTSDHIISAVHWQTWSHSELSTMPWDGFIREGHAPASFVLCTIGLAERTCDVVQWRSNLYRQHCHHLYAMASLLSPPHWYVIGLSQSSHVNFEQKRPPAYANTNNQLFLRLLFFQ